MTTNEIGKAIYGLLSGQSAITNIVNTRIYPISVPQFADFPFVVYTTTDTEPTMTKDGSSPLDVITVQIDMYANDFDTNTSLAGAIRSTLDFYTGTINGQAIQRITMTNNSDGDYNADLGVFYATQDYQIRLKRER